MRTYYLNQIRHDGLEVFQRLGKFKNSDSIIDFGCGPGIISRYLAKHSVAKGQVIGVDITKKMIATAIDSSAKENIKNTKFVEASMYKSPFPDNYFGQTLTLHIISDILIHSIIYPDHAVTRFTFHHLLNPKQALEEMIRVVKPNGTIVVVDATPKKINQDKYNEYEKLRDPSHTIALTSEELIALGTLLSTLSSLTCLLVNSFRD